MALSSPFGFTTYPERQFARRLFSAKYRQRPGRLAANARLMSRHNSVMAAMLVTAAVCFGLALAIFVIALQKEWFALSPLAVFPALLGAKVLFKIGFNTNKDTEDFHRAMLFQLSRHVSRDGLRIALCSLTDKVKLKHLSATIIPMAHLFTPAELELILERLQAHKFSATDKSAFALALNSAEKTPASSPLEINAMKSLIRNHTNAHWDRVFPIWREEIPETEKSSNQLGDAIEDMLKCQNQLFQDAASVLCTYCHIRPKIKTLEFWTWMECPNCQSAQHLQAGIQATVGWLGRRERRGLEGDRFYINIWDESQKKSCLKPVEEIELEAFEGSNWALAATLTALDNNPKLASNIQTVRHPKGQTIDETNLALMEKYHLNIEMI